MTCVIVTSSDLPGLVDVVTEHGENFRDITMGQFLSLALTRSWDVRPEHDYRSCQRGSDWIRSQSSRASPR